MNEDQTPISPDSGISNAPGHTPPSPVPPESPTKESRADLVLMLGILSLFMCGPLGIIAWIIANSDLRKMRAGIVSSRKVGLLKVGKALGIVGAILFVATIFAVAFVIQRNAGHFGGMFTSEPLKADQFAYAGDWLGDRGTFIRIDVDGKADFISSNSRVRGGAVNISGDRLSIGIMGISKSWRIDRPPHMQDGNWTMQLDGETFKRKGEDLVVGVCWGRQLL